MCHLSSYFFALLGRTVSNADKNFVQPLCPNFIYKYVNPYPTDTKIDLHLQSDLYTVG